LRNKNACWIKFKPILFTQSSEGIVSINGDINSARTMGGSVFRSPVVLKAQAAGKIKN